MSPCKPYKLLENVGIFFSLFTLKMTEIKFGSTILKKKIKKKGADSTSFPGRQKPTVRHCRYCFVVQNETNRMEEYLVSWTLQIFIDKKTKRFCTRLLTSMGTWSNRHQELMIWLIIDVTSYKLSKKRKAWNNKIYIKTPMLFTSLDFFS